MSSRQTKENTWLNFLIMTRKKQCLLVLENLLKAKVTTFTEKVAGSLSLKENLLLNSSYEDFVNTRAFEVKTDDIEKLSLTSDKESLEIVKKDKEFIFEGAEDKNYKKEKAEEYVKNLSSVSFDDFYSPI